MQIIAVGVTNRRNQQKARFIAFVQFAYACALF